MENHQLVVCRHEQRSIQGDKFTGDTWRWRCSCGAEDKAQSEAWAKKNHDLHVERVHYGRFY